MRLYRVFGMASAIAVMFMALVGYILLGLSLTVDINPVPLGITAFFAWIIIPLALVIALTVESL